MERCNIRQHQTADVVQRPYSQPWRANACDNDLRSMPNKTYEIFCESCVAHDEVRAVGCAVDFNIALLDLRQPGVQFVGGARVLGRESPNHSGATCGGHEIGTRDMKH